jgi:uncharacterized protein YqhQ
MMQVNEGREDMTSGPVKVGGQALADGVLMRTNRAWAIARADGSVEVGALPPSPAARIPVVRVVAGLAGAVKLAVSRGMLGRGSAAGPAARQSARRLNRRFLAVLVGLEAGAYLLSRAVGDFTTSGRGVAGVAYTVVPWMATLAALRLFTPGSLWRYHGAEHKAVSAHEAGVDLADTAAVLRADRVHNRCGTNLVFLMLVFGLLLRGHVHGFEQVPAFLGLLGLSAEIIGWLAARPQWLTTKVVLSGGKALQRWVTTAEPTAAEQAVGCHALMSCLAEHARIVALDDVPAASDAVAVAA